MKKIFLILAIFSASIPLVATKKDGVIGSKSKPGSNKDCQRKPKRIIRPSIVKKTTLNNRIARSSQFSSGDSYANVKIPRTQRLQSDEKPINKGDFYVFAAGLATITVGVGATIASTLVYKKQ